MKLLDKSLTLINKMLTKDRTQIPLFYVTFNYKHFIENGKIDSCMANIHPVIKDDEYVKLKLGELVDYIRDNYDMNMIP